MNKKKYYKKVIGYFFKKKKAVFIFVITTIFNLIISTINLTIYAKTISSITNVDISSIIKYSIIVLAIALIENVIREINDNYSYKIQESVSLDIKSDV